MSALSSGADDYIVKAFRPRELKARAQALLRRSRGQSKRRNGRNNRWSLAIFALIRGRRR